MYLYLRGSIGETCPFVPSSCKCDVRVSYKSHPQEGSMHFGLSQYLLVNRNDHFMLNIKLIIFY